jgi:predicted MFS family arabinose efflux permease
MLDLLRRNRAFRLLFIAQLVSYCGDWFATVALLGLVGDLTKHSALAASGILIAQTLPAFFMTPLAGPMADRFDRRVIMISASSVQIVAALGFLLVGSGRVWLAFATQGLVAAFGAFFGPASQAAVANLVDPDDLPVAASAMGATWGAMLAVGASLGALFTAAFGRTASFVADAVSFLVAALLIALIRRPTRAQGPGRGRVRPWHDTREAIAFARNDRALLYLLCSKAGLGLASGTAGLLAVMPRKLFHAGDGGIGLMLAARGVGVVVGPLLAGRLGRSSTVPRILEICAFSCLLFAGSYAVVGVAPSLLVAAFFVMLAHTGGGTQWTLSTYGLQASTPDHFRGRILAADFAIVTMTLSISYLGVGLLERHIGPRATVMVMAAIAFVWGLLYLWLTTDARRHATPASA